jgi:hypothetical protein
MLLDIELSYQPFILSVNQITIEISCIINVFCAHIINNETYVWVNKKTKITRHDWVCLRRIRNNNNNSSFMPRNNKNINNKNVLWIYWWSDLRNEPWRMHKSMTDEENELILMSSSLNLKLVFFSLYKKDSRKG